MSKKPTLLLLLSLVLVVLLPGSALPHGGGLNADGCHHDRKRGTYHCHRSQSVRQSPSRVERPEQTPEQQVRPTPETTSVVTPAVAKAGTEYQRCLLVIDGETVELAPGEPVQRSGMALRKTGPQTAQAGPCAPLFDVYSNSEIVDVVVRMRATWMTIAGVKAIPEMLGKAADPYVNAATTCQDITQAHVSPGELKNALRMKRNVRARQVSCLADYRHQMQTPIAEGPLAQPVAVNMQNMAPNDHDLDTKEDKTTLTAQEYGDTWPFTIPRGTLHCEEPGAVTFLTNGKSYAVNGLAKSDPRNADLAEIWKTDSTSAMADHLRKQGRPELTPKISIGPILERGLQLCK